MKQLVKYKSPLYEMTQTTPTCLWNDSASIHELTYSLDHGAVGATCNPVIVGDVLKKEMHLWQDRIHGLIDEMPFATEDQIAWRVVEEISTKGPSSSSRSMSSLGESMAGSRFKRTSVFFVIQRLSLSKPCTLAVWRRTSL